MLVGPTYPHWSAERTILVVLTDNRGRDRRDDFERRRAFISGYVSWGDRTNRNALRCRSFHVASVFPQTEQIACPGVPSIEAHSAIKYEDPHLGHVMSEIFITQVLNAYRLQFWPQVLDTKMTNPRHFRPWPYWARIPRWIVRFVCRD